MESSCTRSTLKSFGIGLVAIAISYTAGVVAANRDWRNELLQKGYGEFNSKNGKWQLCEPEIVLMNLYDPSVRSTSKGITIKEYLTKADIEIKNLRSKLEETDSIYKEQEKLLFTYEKRLGISRKTNDTSSQPTVKVN